MITTIMVAVDGSDASGRAVDLGCELSGATDAELILYHAIRDLPLPPEIREMVNAGEINESRRELLEQTGEILLERAKTRAGSASIGNVRTVMEFGDPGGSIVEFAAANAVDLIIMGSRGLGEVKRLLLGSVSRKVCNLAQTNCLTVR